MARKYRRLSYKDRRTIERMSKDGSRIIEIAGALGVHRDTIYKELARCGATQDTYSADKAQVEHEDSNSDLHRDSDTRRGIQKRL